MTQALIYPETQADRLAVDLAHAERMLTAAETKAHVAEERVVKVQRESAGYLAVIGNMEAAIGALRERRLEDQKLIRNLRAIIWNRVRSRSPVVRASVGSKALVVHSRDSLAQESVGRIGLVTAAHSVGFAETLTMEFADHSVGTFASCEVEADPGLIAALEAAS